MVGLRSSGPVRYPAVAGEPLASTFVARETGPGGPPKPRLLADRGVSWRLLQFLVALANVALYAGLAYWVYTQMRA